MNTPPFARRLGVLDVGSNSVLILVADVHGGRWREVACAETITRLSERLGVGRPFDTSARKRTLSAVRALASRARALGATDLRAAGTRAFRVATDAGAFADQIRAEIGASMEILSADREATLGFAGAALGVRASGLVLGVDIGGASTEVVLGEGARPLEAVSLPIGAVVLTEEFLSGDPPGPRDVDSLASTLARRVRDAVPIRSYAAFARSEALRALARRGRAVVGSGGTLTTIAAMSARLDRYDAERVHGSRLSRQELAEMRRALAPLTIAERSRLAGLDPARAATILAGTMVAEAIMEAAGADDLVVSDQSLRHALLLEWVGQLSPTAR